MHHVTSGLRGGSPLCKSDQLNLIGLETRAHTPRRFNRQLRSTNIAPRPLAGFAKRDSWSRGARALFDRLFTEIFDKLYF